MHIEKNCDLGVRLHKSFARLHEKEYQMHQPLARDGGGWPGDWEGRALLGLVRLAGVLGEKPKYLDEITGAYFSHLAGCPYYGSPVEPGVCDEQQLSGHSWLLLAMCRLFAYNGDKRALEEIKALVSALLLPCAGMYARYPKNPADRIVEGGASGSLTGSVINGWKTSSDVGCAFIMFDGATCCYPILASHDPALAQALLPLLDEMAEAFLTLDFVGVSAQTHATLAGLRGLLRYISLRQKPELLAPAKAIFALYQSQGMTENFANFNWFGRPFWTEPCAYLDSIADSFLLFDLTGDASYIDFVYQVYYNAVGYGQRENGGFGCDVCAGPAGDFLSPTEGGYEAIWCCTMRGGDVLPLLAENAVRENAGETRVLFYTDGETETLSMRTNNFWNGRARLVCKPGFRGPLFLFAPSFAKAFSLSVNGEARAAVPENGFLRVDGLKGGDEVVIEMTFLLEKVPAATAPGKVKFMFGPYVLGVKTGEAVAIGCAAPQNGAFLADGKLRLGPINDSISRTKDDLLSLKTQILF